MASLGTSQELALRMLLKALLMPLSRVCLSGRVTFAVIAQQLRELLTDNARSYLEQLGHKVTASRIALMTGIPRKDITARLKQPDQSARRTAGNSSNLMASVIGRWQSARPFIDASQQPKPLSFGSASSEFNQLVDGVSRDVNPATVLFELERVGAVERVGDRVQLRVRSFVPIGDPARIFGILGADLCDLSRAVEENVFRSPDAIPHLHARTHFDKIRADKADELKRWLLEEGHAFHSRVRAKLASLDQDLAPDPFYSGKTIDVTVGAFSFITESDDGDS